MNTTLNATLQSIANHTAPIEITVTPAPTPMPGNFATTALDWQPIPVFGIPFWAVLALLSFAVFVLVIIHWHDKSSDINAIKPWFIKAKEIAVGKMQVVRLSRAGNFIPDCLSIFDNVLSYGDSEENINQWHLNSPRGILRIGGIQAAVVSEDWDQNRDIVTEIAICYAADNIENNMDDLRRRLKERHARLVKDGLYPEDAEDPSELVRPIHNGLDYIGQTDEGEATNYKISGRRVLQLLYPDGVRIPAFNQYNQNKFRKFWLRGDTSAFFGGQNIRRVEDEFVKRTDQQPGFFQKYGAMMLAALVFLGCIIGGIAVPMG